MTGYVVFELRLSITQFFCMPGMPHVDSTYHSTKRCHAVDQVDILSTMVVKTRMSAAHPDYEEHLENAALKELLRIMGKIGSKLSPI